MAQILTYRDMVSRIRSSFKLLSSDDSCTDRYILSEIISTNKEMVLREINARKGLNSPSLFTFLPCIPMEKTDLFSCCDATTNCKLARSSIELPQIVASNYNLVVQGVWSIDRKVRFKEIGNPDRYANYLAMNISRSKERFFWMQDSRLYVTDPIIEKVSMSAFFSEPINPLTYTCDKKQTCLANPMDLEFKSLPKVEDSIIKIVADKLNKTYKRSVADPTENDLSEEK